MLQTPRGLDVDLDKLHEVVARLRPTLSAEDYAHLETAVEALRYLEELVADQTVTMTELRRLIVVHGGTEKTADVLRRLGLEQEAPRPTPPTVPTPVDTTPRAPARGHGRLGAAAFTGARRIVVPHETLRHGDRCPECGRGNVYVQQEPKRQIRFVG